MNKQEAIEEIKNLEGLTILDKTINFDSEMIPKKEVLNIVNQIDEPEKPVLTKEEAEWVDKLTDVYDVPDALYYITRCGYGYDLTFEICGKTYELPLEDGITYGELYKLKERLVNVVLYGYEVEKEKLYTVKFANEDFGKMYIGIFKKFNKLGISSLPLNNDEVKSWFTEDELKRFKFWDNPAFETEEVEE